MDQQEFQNLLNKYTSGQCTEQEEKLVQDWFDRIDFTLTPLEVNKRLETKDEIGQQIWKRISAKMAKPERQIFMPYVLRAAAIFITGLIIVWMLHRLDKNSVNIISKTLNSNTFSVSNEYDHPQQVRLGDGSVVVLQPKSNIRWLKEFEIQRKVYLTGEASFHVVRDTLHPFLVYSDEVVTRVLGTSFTVKAKPNEDRVIVSVQSGKVSVFTRVKAENQGMPADYQQKYILTPNQQVVYIRTDSTSKMGLVEKPAIILTKPTLTRVRYDGVLVRDMFTLLQENYGVEIDFNSHELEHCIITTTFNHEGLFERIDLICNAIGAKYEIVDGKIFIKGSSCQ